ncbi:unnamed protein product [Absidia cylindrospora]
MPTHNWSGQQTTSTTYLGFQAGSQAQYAPHLTQQFISPLASGFGAYSTSQLPFDNTTARSTMNVFGNHALAVDTKSAGQSNLVTMDPTTVTPAYHFTTRIGTTESPSSQQLSSSTNTVWHGNQYQMSLPLQFQHTSSFSGDINSTGHQAPTPLFGSALEKVNQVEDRSLAMRGLSLGSDSGKDQDEFMPLVEPVAISGSSNVFFDPPTHYSQKWKTIDVKYGGDKGDHGEKSVQNEPSRAQFPLATGNGPSGIQHSSTQTKALDPPFKKRSADDAFANDYTTSIAVPCWNFSFGASIQPSTSDRSSKKNNSTHASVEKLGVGAKSCRSESIGGTFSTTTLMEQPTSTTTYIRTSIITNEKEIGTDTRYSELPEVAQDVLLEAEQYINSQKSLFRSGRTGVGAFIDHDILRNKDQARELMQTAGTLNAQLEEQKRTLTHLGIEVQQQMDAAVIGKVLVGDGSGQQILQAGNHYHHYFSRLYERLQDQIAGFKSAIWHIECHLHQQQQMTTQKLGEAIATQNALLMSLSAQASKLHQLVQEMLSPRTNQPPMNITL